MKSKVACRTILVTVLEQLDVTLPAIVANVELMALETHL